MQKEIFKKIDERFDTLEGQIDLLAIKSLEHDQRFDKIDDQIDALAIKAVEHDKRFDDLEEKINGLPTKKDHEQIITTLDEIRGIVKKTDQEITMMGNRVGRIDKKVEEHEKNFLQIKPMLGLS
jgi:chromosome segregation ATPase